MKDKGNNLKNHIQKRGLCRCNGEESGGGGGE